MKREQGNAVRFGAVLAGLAAALCGMVALSVATGPMPVSLRDIARALLGGGDDAGSRVVLLLRLPRALLGVLVGGALASSGAAFQALLRNPLADPYILGVSGGAAVGALTATLFLSQNASFAVPPCAFAGAALSALVVFLLARKSKAATPERLILMGVVVGAFLNAVIMLMVSLSPPGKIPGVLYWLMGDLGHGTNTRVMILLPYVALGALALFLLARGLDLLLLGEEEAFHAGLDVERAKTMVYLVASLLAGSVVAVSGLIGFVGLIVPHAARTIVGSGHRRLLPAAFMMGGAFLVFSDLIARTVSPSGELPVGAVTALAGAPFFLVLLRGGGKRS
ncbi:MAG: iron ABC transporter permease [Syntrophorhabdaceae bacterium]|nr:iron ABC transporter permease [Syntrophorhabdaceae bacterium]